MSLFIPSYAQGFAKSAAEAAYPELWDGLAGAWLLNESGGTTAFDCLRRNPGTLTNMTPGTDRIHGHWRGFSFGAINFAGDDDYIAIPNGFFSAYPFTLVATFRATDIATNLAIFVLNDSADNQNWQGLRVGNSEVHAASRNAAQQDASTAISANVWYHAAAVFASSTSRKIYVNGLWKATDTDALTTRANDVCTIGRYSDSSPSSYFSGDIAECLIYDRALSAGAIKCLYDIGPGALFRLRPRVLNAPAALFVPYPRPRGLRAGMGELVGGMC